MTNWENSPSARIRKPKFLYGYVVVLAGFLIMMVVWGTYYSFGVFFNPLLAEFGWARAVTSGAYSLSLLVFGPLATGAGRLTDRFGPRLVLTASGFLLGLGYLLMSQIGAIWQIYLFYGVIIGIGMGASYVPPQSTVARWFVKRRGLMTGIIVSGIGLGIIIIPPLATRLISSYGWRTSYIIVGIAVSALVILMAQFLRRDPAQMGQSPYGADEVKTRGLDLEARGFFLQEALHTRQLWILCAAFFCFAFSLNIIMVHIAPHAIELGISVISAANILAVIGAVSIAGRIIMGGATDRIGNRRALIIGFIVMSLALFWLLAARELWMLYLFAAIFGFAYGGLTTIESPIVAELFGLRSHGVILGIILFLSMSIGGSIGPVLAGRIFDITSSYQPAFLVCAGLSAIGLMLAALLTLTSKGGEK